MHLAQIEKLRNSALNWFSANQRELPWRKNRDPYRIWISEVMLQQTTVTAVIPYYHKFLNRFPDAQNLAQSPIEDVYDMWAGLGYYSRAKNLHLAAQFLSKSWPKTHAQLLSLPGFGPYTSRAVASIAFDEPVGVVDGNVIRVLSRVFALKEKWWTSKGRLVFQKFADSLAKENSSKVNQALMELGATICTPKSPSCALCPWLKDCKYVKLTKLGKSNRTETLPLSKPKRKNEIWGLKIFLQIKNGKIALVNSPSLPFLKGKKMPPLEAYPLTSKPQDFSFKHSITHHNIYVTIARSKKKFKNLSWVEIENLKKVNPSSLLQKALKIDCQKKGMK